MNWMNESCENLDSTDQPTQIRNTRLAVGKIYRICTCVYVPDAGDDADVKLVRMIYRSVVMVTVKINRQSIDSLSILLLLLLFLKLWSLLVSTCDLSVGFSSRVSECDPGLCRQMWAWEWRHSLLIIQIKKKSWDTIHEYFLIKIKLNIYNYRLFFYWV